MAVHRYEAYLGKIPSSGNHPKILEFFERCSKIGIPESKQDGKGLLLAIRNNLSRTTEQVGLNIIIKLEKLIGESDNDWLKFDNTASYFNIRAQSEMNYIGNVELSNPEELETIKKHIQSKKPLIALLN